MTDRPAPVPHPIGPWRVRHAVLRMELSHDRVVTTTDLHVEPVGGVDTGPLVLDGRDLETMAVAVDGRDLAAGEYALADRSLTVDLGPGPHVVRTVVAAVPGRPNDKGFVSGHGLLSTNLEPQGFRRITWFVDAPANRATYDVTLVGDPAVFPVMRANGDPSGAGTLDDGRTWARFVDPVDKPSYLFAMVAGDLRTRSTTHTTRTGRTITLTVAAPPDLIDGADFALWAMPVVLAFDEENGGIEHDLDELVFVAVPGYPDATEYHGLMFFDPSLLVADTRGHVDDDLILVLLNVAHEYGHHVRGNRVTVRTWGELTLKEGLTVLTAQNDVRAHVLGPAGRILDVLDLRRLQFPEEVTIGAPPLRGEVSDPTALYNRTTYLKGAEIFGMIRTLLGRDAWLDVFTAFVSRHDLGAAAVEDFLAVARERVPEHSARIDAIARWFTRVGRPALSVSVADADAVVVERTDGLTDDPCVGMPLVLGFRSPDGSPLPVSVEGSETSDVHTVVLADRAARLRVDAPGPFVLAPLRGYSAPVDVTTDLPDEHLAVLLEHEDDPYATWWAGQELMTRAVDAFRSGDIPSADVAVGLLCRTLGRVAPATDDPVLLAQLLTVPDEFALGDRDPVVDVDGVADGLAFLRRRLGEELRGTLLDVWQRFVDDPHGSSPADIGVRMLVEPVLAPLLAVADPDGTALAIAALDAPNATRAMRAFSQLLHVDHVPADDLVAATYDRWQAAPKLVDRWLRAQSGARRADTIQRVAALAAGPLYDRGDRARVMGVWFPFATRNRVVFHHPSGDGYRVFVDELGELMPVNAGVAVRLVGDLLQYKRFDDHRRTLMRAELQRMTTMDGMPGFAVDIINGLLAD